MQPRPQGFFLPVSFAPQERLGENPTNEIANRDPANMAIEKQTTKKWADVTCLCMIALGNKTVELNLDGEVSVYKWSSLP